MIVTRFAPSPTGLLHLGHAFAAITACKAGKRFVVRIEDIDAGRCRPEYETAILEDLDWLGLRFEQPVLRQSTRMAAYRAALNILDARGLLYPCFCTRKEIAEEIARSAGAPHGPDGPVYPGLCRSLDANERIRRIAGGAAYALRLDAAKAALAKGDTKAADADAQHVVDTVAKAQHLGKQRAEIAELDRREHRVLVDHVAEKSIHSHFSERRVVV